MTFSDYAHLRNRPHVQPHGCWLIVAQALSEVHGVDLPADWGADLADDDLRGRALLLHEHLARHGVEVEAPRAGDVAAFARHGRPVHVGLVVAPGWVLQSTSTIGAAHFVRLADLRRQYGSVTFHRPLQLAEIEPA